MHGMVEVMRGCGRGCKFCDVTLRSLRYYSPEKVKKEIEVNIKKGWNWIEHGFIVMIFLFMEWIFIHQKIWNQIVMH